MLMNPKDPPRNGSTKHLDNYRIFRPQAVEAYSTRHAGEPWATGTRFESWIILGLTTIALAAAAAIFLGGH